MGAMKTAARARVGVLYYAYDCHKSVSSRYFSRVLLLRWQHSLRQNTLTKCYPD
jgi:hypothetical protein